MEQFVIEARRSSGSIFGAATTLLKNNGEILVFDDRETAQARIDEIRRGLVTLNVSYRVVPASDYMFR